ncbi:MAG: sigma-70 family RNA polymerase sigma factor [Planctomycetota bacterium]
MRGADDRLFARWCERADSRALASLFDRCAPRLLQLALHVVGDAAEAEDLVQATFLALIEQRTSLDSKRPVWPWLAGVLGHKARDVQRRRSRRFDPQARDERVAEDPSESLERRELSGELLAALDRLEEPYRQPLVLRLRHGLPVADIAHVLDRSPATVRVQLHRGRELLRRLLPASLAGGLALGTATRGLAAVRVSVLREAAIAGSALAAPPILGAIFVKSKLALASTAVACVAIVLWPRDDAQLTEEPATPAARPETPLAGIPTEVPLLTTDDLRSDGEERSPVAPRAQLRGQVLDAATGQPIPGATVRLYSPRRATLLEVLRDRPQLYEVQPNGVLRPRLGADWPRLANAGALARFGREQVLAYDEVAPDAEPLAVTTTDDEGRFALDADSAGGLLVCEREGYARRVRAAHDPELEWPLALWRMSEVVGRVITQRGDPPGVPLLLALTAVHHPRSPELSADDPNPYPVGGPEGLGTWTAECGADGRFRTSVAADTVVPFVLTPGWKVTAKQIAPVERPLRVIVLPVPVLHVFDAASGEPIERVRLVGLGQSDGFVHWSGEFDAPGGRVELPGGAYALTAWNESSTVFRVWAEGYLGARLVLTDLTLPEVYSVPLERGAMPKLEGHVRRGGAPAQGAVAALLGYRSFAWREDVDTLVDAVRVDAHGAFQLTVPTGRYLLRIELGDARYFEVVDLPASGPVDIDLSDTSRIDVTVVDQAAAPRAGHAVALTADDGRRLRGETGEDGTFSFEGLSPQAYRLFTPFISTKSSLAADVIEDIELARGEVRAVRLEVPRLDGALLLRVVARGVASFEGWSWRCDSSSWAALGPDGSVEIERAAPAWVIEVEDPGHRRWSMRLPRGGGNQDGDVVLDRGVGAYRGRCTDAEGKPLSGWRVYALAQEGYDDKAPVPSAKLDRDGRFELRGLAPCVHRLELRSPSEAGRCYRFDLRDHSFLPDASAANAPELLIEFPRDVGQYTLRGVVLRASDRTPLSDAILRFGCQSRVPAGLYYLGNETARTDDQGRFEVVVSRTSQCTLKVYETWTADGLVHEQIIEDDGLGDPPELEVLVN